MRLAGFCEKMQTGNVNSTPEKPLSCSSNPRFYSPELQNIGEFIRFCMNRIKVCRARSWFNMSSHGLMSYADQRAKQS